MITIYKKIGGKLAELPNVEDDCWINVVNPGEAEIRALAEQLNVPADFLADPLDLDERARIEIEDDCSLIILHTPVRAKDDEDETPFTTAPIGIILKKDSLITVCQQESEILRDFIELRIKNFIIHDRARFIIQIFLHTAIKFLKYLKEINKKTNSLEKDLRESLQNEALVRLMNIERSLVYFMTSIQANEIVMARITRADIVRLDDLDKDLLDDAITENLQALRMSKIYSNILSGMMDAFASIISNNVNTVMKFLTSVTIILMIPNLIASMYGMNVELPFQHSMNAFIIVMVGALVLSLLGVWVFLKKKWL